MLHGAGCKLNVLHEVVGLGVKLRFLTRVPKDSLLHAVVGADVTHSYSKQVHSHIFARSGQSSFQKLMQAALGVGAGGRCRRHTSWWKAGYTGQLAQAVTTLHVTSRY